MTPAEIKEVILDILEGIAPDEDLSGLKDDVALREHGFANGRPSETANGLASARSKVGSGAEPMTTEARRVQVQPGPAVIMGRTHVNGFEGSPLDPRYTFESFVVGPANRMAHAAAIQVAETVFAEERGFNPLYLHASVGLGKTHLQHAIAWEVKRRAPKASILYLTAERFRYQFVEAIKSQDAMASKDKFRSIDILLVDDLEFMRGEKTEQEFEHIINQLLDGGKQVVVASARPPVQLDGLNDRMRSRLQRGLVTEISAMDAALRLKVLEKRAQEKRAVDPSFEIPSEVVTLLAERLTESGRELEGAINRLYLTWQLMRAPVTLDIAETIIRDRVQGIEPRRIKIEDILRIVSRHFAVSKQDILSQRRHRSVVRPRQIGMYLAKHLTSRSLPEIGRRFGDRDHTTVLHAIRKIDREVGENPRLKDEIDELKRQLSR
jgi:chromosomal replication initiator protein